jgi:hypothetical protein
LSVSGATEDLFKNSKHSPVGALSALVDKAETLIDAFQVEAVLDLGFDSPYRPSARAQLPSGAQAVKTTRFNCCAFCSKGSETGRTGFGRCESGIAASTKVKQEVSHICSM